LHLEILRQVHAVVGLDRRDFKRQWLLVRLRLSEQGDREAEDRRENHTCGERSAHGYLAGSMLQGNIFAGRVFWIAVANLAERMIDGLIPLAETEPTMSPGRIKKHVDQRADADGCEHSETSRHPDQATRDTEKNCDSDCDEKSETLAAHGHLVARCYTQDGELIRSSVIRTSIHKKSPRTNW
jgi:hypothetical protein